MTDAAVPAPRRVPQVPPPTSSGRLAGLLAWVRRTPPADERLSDDEAAVAGAVAMARRRRGVALVDDLA